MTGSTGAVSINLSNQNASGSALFGNSGGCGSCNILNTTITANASANPAYFYGVSGATSNFTANNSSNYFYNGNTLRYIQGSATLYLSGSLQVQPNAGYTYSGNIIDNGSGSLVVNGPSSFTLTGSGNTTPQARRLMMARLILVPPLFQALKLLAVPLLREVRDFLLLCRSMGPLRVGSMLVITLVAFL